jgi:hypothetical protein
LTGDHVRPLGFPEEVALKRLLMVDFSGRPRAPAMAADEYGERRFRKALAAAFSGNIRWAML